MAQKECGNGHIYDTDLYSECPYCEHESSSVDFEGISSKTIGDYRIETVKTSVPVTSITPGNQDDIGKTVATADALRQQSELGKTVAIYHESTGLDPVVAWLVCIKGNNIGKDYRLLAKTNKIGRSEDMDVKISGDMTITSDTHAKIDYDVLNNDFYLLTGNNSSTIYMNKAPVYVPQKLSPYDVLRFGQSEFMFVPFCSDKFKWPDKDSE